DSVGFPAATTDTHPHARKIWAKVVHNRFYTMMPRGTTATFDTQATALQIEIVMNHNEVASTDRRIEARQRFSAQVHVQLRFDQQCRLSGNAAPGRAQTPVGTPERKLPAMSEFLHDFESNVVTRFGVCTSGIAEACDDAHRLSSRAPFFLG